MITDFIKLNPEGTRIDAWRSAEAIHAAGKEIKDFPEVLTPAGDTIREEIFPLDVDGLEIFPEDVQTIFEDLETIENE